MLSWQVPAIECHFGNLDGKVFLDIGAGDIVPGEALGRLGVPDIFYAQDLNQASLDEGLTRMREVGHATEHIITMSSDNFTFNAIPDATVDFAFSNSLFSHLSINSIILCLRKLAPKMRPSARYLTSMILIPMAHESEPYDWSGLGTEGSAVVSHPNKDPYHYSASTLSHIVDISGAFELAGIHDYGHPFQKLVEFRLRD